MRINISLTSEDKALLDALSVQSDMSNSAVIRRGLKMLAAASSSQVHSFVALSATLPNTHEADAPVQSTSANLGILKDAGMQVIDHTQFGKEKPPSKTHGLDSFKPLPQRGAEYREDGQYPEETINLNEQ
jgi:hypothetical protein